MTLTLAAPSLQQLSQKFGENLQCSAGQAIFSWASVTQNCEQQTPHCM